MKLMNLFRMAVALFCVFSLADAQVVAQRTTFTYQGKLNADGIPAAGQTLQFTFTLYNAATGGAVVGSPINQSILVGSGGLFTTDLDFGQAFNGTQNWLDIQVGTTVANEQEAWLAPGDQFGASRAIRAEYSQSGIATVSG